MGIFYINLDKKFKDQFDLGKFISIDANHIRTHINSYFLRKVKELPVKDYIQIKQRAMRADTLSYELFNKNDTLWWLILYYNNISNYKNLKNGMLLKIFNISNLQELISSLSDKELIRLQENAVDATATIDNPVISTSTIPTYLGEALPSSTNVLWIKPSTNKTYVYNEGLSLWVSTDTNSMVFGLDYNNVTNQYLRYSALSYSNITTFRATTDILISSIDIRTDALATWSLELKDLSENIYSGGSFPITLKDTLLTNQTFKLLTNDVLRVYINGTGIKNPTINLIYHEVISP